MSWSEWKHESAGVGAAIWGFLVEHRAVAIALVVGIAFGAWAC